MLEGQCDVWNGVISAAVYIALLNGKAVTVELNSNQDPRLTDMAEVEAKFKQFHQLAEAKGEGGGARGGRAARAVGDGARCSPVRHPAAPTPTTCAPVGLRPASQAGALLRQRPRTAGSPPASRAACAPHPPQACASWT